MYLPFPSILIASSFSASGLKNISKRAPSNQVCAPAPSPGQGATIDLGLAYNYAIFSSTGIADSVPGSSSVHIYGDIGVAPIAMTAITGFALTQVSASDDSAKSVYVSGSVYGPAHPISSTATTGDVATDVLTAYNCGKSYPALAANNVAAAGFLDGRTFTKGVYKWSGAVSLGANAKVYLNGVYGDVFIFNAAGAFSTGAGSSIVLGGTLTSASVYWVGSTSLTTGAASAFAGIILTGTNVVIAGTLDGAVLAQTDVALDSATITLPVAPLAPCPTGYARQGSSATCTSASTATTTTTSSTISKCPHSTYSTDGTNCVPYKYARFASYDCDQSLLNNFYGNVTTDWVGTLDGDGNRLYFSDNVDALEGACENTCQTQFANPKNVDNGFQAFVFVPYTSAEATIRKSQLAQTPTGNPSYPYSPFLCYCKRQESQAALSRSSVRSCNLVGSCENFKHLITDYATANPNAADTPVCQDVSYSATTQACIVSDGSTCTTSLP